MHRKHRGRDRGGRILARSERASLKKGQVSRRRHHSPDFVVTRQGGWAEKSDKAAAADNYCGALTAESRGWHILQCV